MGQPAYKYNPLPDEAANKDYPPRPKLALVPPSPPPRYHLIVDISSEEAAKLLKMMRRRSGDKTAREVVRAAMAAYDILQVLLEAGGEVFAASRNSEQVVSITL